MERKKDFPGVRKLISSRNEKKPEQITEETRNFSVQELPEKNQELGEVLEPLFRNTKWRVMVLPVAHNLLNAKHRTQQRVSGRWFVRIYFFDKRNPENLPLLMFRLIRYDQALEAFRLLIDWTLKKTFERTLEEKKELNETLRALKNNPVIAITGLAYLAGKHVHLPEVSLNEQPFRLEQRIVLANA